jgi:4-hydroxyphenylpyruvate dioxygenase-like putative hemolysin
VPEILTPGLSSEARLMRIGHIALSCKAEELDEVAEYYKKLGFVIYKTTVLGGLKGHFVESVLKKTSNDSA